MKEASGTTYSAVEAEQLTRKMQLGKCIREAAGGARSD
jgi:hypothetical protein